MEFYRSKRRKESLRKRFNSQRDGILLNLSSKEGLGTSSFNSQRDGILHLTAKNESDKITVSIPNGMEFYSTNFAIFLGRKC